jgi:hypothetical protein
MTGLSYYFLFSETIKPEKSLIVSTGDSSLLAGYIDTLFLRQVQ